MEYIQTPNLPQKPVEIFLVDGRISFEIEQKILKLGTSIIKTKPHRGLNKAVCYHPDMMFHHIGGDIIVYAQGVDESLLNELRNKNFTLIKGDTILKKDYPYNIAFNIARVGNYAIHNFLYTDNIVKKLLIQNEIELINVKQGYSKCSISVIDHKTIITSDKGILKACQKYAIEVLLIEEDVNIKLPGHNCGFIGGSSALIAEKNWVVTGNICNLKSCQIITNFLKKKKINIISLSDSDVVDIGSLIPLSCK